jgi:GntR family transcriptional regulator
VFFKINQTNGVPVYEQISRQIAFAIASEGIAVGELVPSVRNLSRDLAVARAYRQLQDEGILETVRGEGLLVTSTAVNQCKTLRKQLLSERMLQVMEEARQSHLSDEEVENLVAKCLQKSKTSYAKNRSSS